MCVENKKYLVRYDLDTIIRWVLKSTMVGETEKSGPYPGAGGMGYCPPEDIKIQKCRETLEILRDVTEI